MEMNKIFQGDCIEVLQTLPDNSIDLVVTDPPYGLSFMGKDWDKTLPPREAFEGIIRVLKPGALAFVMSSPRQDVLWRMLSMLEGVGFELTQSYIDWIYKTGFPKAYDISKGIDKKLGKLDEREHIGSYEHPDGNPRSAKLGGNINAYGKYGKIDWNYPLTSGGSFEAKLWDGWKSQTGLKPAHEPILMVNKPFSEPTIVDNVLKWGTGAINVDACRIPLKGEPQPTGSHDLTSWRVMENRTDKQEWHPNITQVEGRFPANLLVSDKAIDTGELSKSTGGITKGKLGNRIYGSFENIKPQDGEGGYGDVGDQSRYFDLDAWAEHHGFLDVPKPDNKERSFGVKGRNIHPTVKPIKLMAYLIELGCPPDGVVLDPFMGSGTTCIAAKQLVRKYIGIEINPEYFEIAKARIAAYPNPLSWFE